MASSSNRFAVLGESSSSSKEQQTKMPVTGTADTEDQAMQDTAQAGPSMSMGGLESSLPRVPTKEERLADFKKKRAAIEADRENERAKKSRQSQTSSRFVARPVACAVPDSDDDMVEEAGIDCRNIINPEKRRRCVFRYEDAAGSSFGPIGSIWNPENKGWGVYVNVDAGRWGSASLSLLFRFNKGDRTAPLSKKEGDFHECDVTWRIGVRIEGTPVVETLRVLRAQGEGPHDSVVMNSCPKEQSKTHLERLAAIKFKCNSARVSDFNETWLEGLEDHVKDGLKKLFLGVGTHMMTIWFLVYPTMDIAMKNWGRHLETAVTSGYGAFWQYRAANGQPNFSIEDTEPIQSFNKGMYVNYRPKRDRNNEPLFANGRPVDDKTQIKDYYNFPREITWEVPYEFAVYGIVPVIRDIQFSIGQGAHLSTKPQLVYLQKMPNIPLQKVKGGYVQKELVGVFKGFVRQTTVGAVPPPGAQITAQWDNSNARMNKPHCRSTDFRDIWKGTVLKNMEASCRATGTDFCVLFSKPSGGHVPRTHRPVDENLPNERLVLAHIDVVIDQTAAKREMDGMAKLADPNYDPVGLGPIRMALMSDPSRVTHTTSDLTARNPNQWRKWEKYCAWKYRENRAQFKVVTSIKEVKNKLTACVGPPGTGKTTVLADITIGAVLCGHTTLVCAVSNNAVDKAANSCWENFPVKERKRYKFLRYETASAEMRAYLTRKDIHNPAAQDQNARPTYKDAPTAEDDDVILQTMAEAAAKYSEHDRELRDLVEKLGDYNEALAQKAETDSRKQSNVPSAMTLPNRIYDMTMADMYNANGDYLAEIEAYKSDKLDAAELKRIRESREYRTEAQLIALGEDRLDQAEIDARERDGRIPSVQQRDKSAKYRASVQQYIRKNGDVSKQDKLTFETLRMPIVIRVMKETDVLFTTCNNAGSDMVQIGFSPSFINIDEAGQLTLAAFANVLTSFKGWEAVIIFGDPKQLLPFFLSGRANEFRANAESSVLSQLEEKEYPILRLVLQYRMAPAISEWPSKFFYNGLLENHPAVLADKDHRRVAREISKEHYNIRGPSGHGSEYWMVDVANGVSRVQSNGTSLQNFASANRIALLVDQALAKGVNPSKITVLVYYTGQLTLVAHKIEATTQANNRKWTFSEGSQVSTVDSFQGEENEFVFIDIVVAHQGGPQEHTGADAEDSEDDSPEGFKRSGRVTAHVKSPNRLCCALTRGRSCVVVVCQLAAILGTVKNSQLKASASVSCMAKDLLDRKLVSHDYTSTDTSPAGEAMRAAWDQTKLESELHRKKMENYSMLSTQWSKANKARFTDESRDAASKVYRTGSRRTTRPNMSGAVAEAAETADIASGRNRSTLETEAGAVTLATGSGTQNAAKQEKKAKQAARRKAVAEEAAEEASSGKGKGKAKAMPVDPKGKGKEKEVDDPSTMDTMMDTGDTT